MADAQNRTALKTEGRPGGASTNSFSKDASTVQSRTLPPLDVALDVDQLNCNVFIGLGRTGIETLIAARQRLESHNLNVSAIPPIWFGIDTDRASIEAACDISVSGAMKRSELIHIPLRDPQYYKEQPKDLFQPVSRRWLYNIPRSKNTEGVRALGLLAFLDNTFAFYDALGSTLAATIAQLQESYLPKNLNIYLVASAHGGTGSALLAEAGFLARRVVAELRAEVHDLAQERITAVLTTGSNEENAAYELASASAVACIQELEHYNRTGLHPGFPSLPSFPLAVAPIDDVYLLHGGRLGRGSDWQQAIMNAAEFLCQDAFSSLGCVMRKVRSDLHNVVGEAGLEYHPWLRTFSAMSIQLTGDVNPVELSKHWLLETLMHWFTAMNASLLGEATDSPLSSDGHSRPSHQRKTLQAIELFCDDLFRDNHWNAQAWVRMLFEKLLPQVDSTPNPDDALMQAMERLLDASTNPALEEVQSALDISISTCERIAASLVDQALQSLTHYIRLHWLKHQSNLAFVSLVLNHVKKRLLRNSESLNIVSNRFEERRISVEKTRLSNSDLSTTDPQRIESELSTLAVQKSVHSLAALLLQRLAQLVDSLDNLWQHEAVQLRATVRTHYLQLAKNLNLSVDDKLNVQQVYFPLPGVWKKIRAEVQAHLDHWVGGHAISLMDSVWTTAKAVEEDHVTDTLTLAKKREKLNLEELLKLSERMLYDVSAKFGIAHDGKLNNVSTQLSADSISEAIRGANCSMLTDGCAKRLILILPKSQSHLNGHTSLPKELLESVSIVYSDLAESPSLIIDGEQIHFRRHAASALACEWSTN